MDKEQTIEGVIVEELKQIPDERGRVMHMMRADNPLFEKFGEIYFSEILPGVVKAWKRHKMMTQLLAVPVGMIKLVIYDDREDSKSKDKFEVLEIGRDNYQLVMIRPKLWYGFKCISGNSALVANCTDFPHDPDEYETKAPNANTLPYQW